MLIWNKKLIIHRLDIPQNKRIIVVSDIHGNLEYFKGLLKKLDFCENDVLIIDGDFLEKGERSLETLRYMMELSKAGNVYPLCGNCDSWAEVVDWPEFDGFPRLLNYMLLHKYGIFYEMLIDSGIEVSKDTDMGFAVPFVREKYRAEWDYLRALPVCIDTPKYTFVHGGISSDIPLAEHTCGQCMKMDCFRFLGNSFQKWVIVGHWPTTLYIKSHVCSLPIIDEKEKIISIDGGCVLKDDGQLNALIIPYYGSEDFSTVYYDPFPTRRARDLQAASEESYYIRWGDSEVEVLSQGDEFSRCRHVRTGYEMDILTKFLFIGDDGKMHTNDCSDYALSVSPGDELGIIETTSRGTYVKSNGTCGWYYGEFDD